MEYILEYHFNGKLLLMYNSTEKKYTGYTPKAELVATKWTGTYDILMRESDKDLLCKANAAAVWDTIRMNTGDLCPLFCIHDNTINWIKHSSGKIVVDVSV